jgi:hypothetical protein
MFVRVRLEKPRRSDWHAPVRVLVDAGAVVTCVAAAGLPLYEWRAAVGVVCITAAAHHMRVAVAQYRGRRTSV